MDKEPFFCLGKISKTFGYKGQVIVVMNSDSTEPFEELEFVFVGIQHERVPFFIEECIAQSKNTFVVKLEYINNPDDAKQILGCNLYIPESERKSRDNQEPDASEWQGYEVTDVKAGYVGIIADILELPQQQVMKILHDTKEILVPLNADFIKKIDHKKKTLLIEAPEGLIDFYRQ